MAADDVITLSDSEAEIVNVSGPLIAAVGVASRVKSRALNKRKSEQGHGQVPPQVPVSKKSKQPRKKPPRNAAPPKTEEDQAEVKQVVKKRKAKAAAASKPGSRKLEPVQNKEDDDFAEEPPKSENDEPEDDEEDAKEDVVVKPRQRQASRLEHLEAIFCGKPISQVQAKRRWPKRFNKDDDAMLRSLEHYEEARVDGVCYSIGDCVSVLGENSAQHFGKIMELFKSTTKENMFLVQWFYQLDETAIEDVTKMDVPFDSRRIFLSEEEQDILLESITGKITVCQIKPSAKPPSPSSCDYYYSMCYRKDLSTFYKPPDNDEEMSSVYNDGTSGSKSVSKSGSKSENEISSDKRVPMELSILDLYSGCGGMSTGLSMGAALAGASFVAKWTVDMNGPACESLKYNHPEAAVHEMDAESFLLTLKEWNKLCVEYGQTPAEEVEEDSNEDSSEGSDSDTTEGYEVQALVGFRMTLTKECQWQQEYEVQWKGYSSDQNSWEPAENLNNCEGRIREFVVEGMKKRIFPLPGDVDIICGGPPCQGASGYNRFRNTEKPMECPRNRQIVIFMDIVEFLKPRFVLMENVVDILKFCDGILGRYAMFRLVNMHYQVKLGLLTAGSFGLPQYRMRVFLWGASPSERLPPFPLPTHDVIPRGGCPNRFLANVVQHDHGVQLEKAMVLQDAIWDLPAVENSESRNEMEYTGGPSTSFQRLIRSAKEVFYKQPCKIRTNRILHDHLPLQLNEDDYQRTCRIPKKKGANFRDLGGLRLRADNTIERDPKIQKELLPSGKPVVPDYAVSYVKGKSTKPFARLWWDETVPTVVTRAEPHNQRILHPEQDRVLTVRENARLQGFPDWYKLFGTVKQRYTQIGNAVAVPVARALGYSLALTVTQGMDVPVVKLPDNFPHAH